MQQDKEHFLIGQLDSPYIGDDGAVIGSTVYSADAFCEGIHFRREWMHPAQIGRKAMLANLSDAVAMNASPRYALVTLAIPRDFSEEAITELVGALEATAREWGCAIIGGDTVGGERLHLSITLISHSDAPLYRTGIVPGDLLAYTGILGESRRDLLRLEAGEGIEANSRFFLPTLRGDFIQQARPWLRAGMDISDGLYCDINTLLEANRCGIDLQAPIDPEIGLSGEEYEMLIAFDPENRSAIETIAQSMGLPLTVIGTVAANTRRMPCQSHHFG